MKRIRPPRIPNCQVCGDPIAPGQGYLEIFNVNPALGPVGCYPQRASRPLDRDGNYGSDPPGVSCLYSLEELVEADFEEVNIGFKLVHGRCDPDPNSTGYAIDIDDVRSAEGWLRIMYEVGAEKSWMSLGDLRRMMEIWPLYQPAEVEP